MRRRVFLSSAVLLAECLGGGGDGRREVCGQAVTEIDYRIVALFDGGLSGRVGVGHDGERFLGASHDDS